MWARQLRGEWEKLPPCPIVIASFEAQACNPYQLDVSAGVSGVIGRQKAGSVTEMVRDASWVTGVTSTRRVLPAVRQREAQVEAAHAAPIARHAYDRTHPLRALQYKVHYRGPSLYPHAVPGHLPMSPTQNPS